MRLWTVAAALVACVLCLEAALFLAGQAEPWLRSHMIAPWFMPACNIVMVACLAVAGLRRKKSAAEDERLTPLVRRDPKTGLRQL